MKIPKVMILSGYGLNCEEETKFAFEVAGAKADIVHVNDLIDKRFSLKNYQILAFPGGFSFGDDTGSGNAFANKLKSHLWKDVSDFVARDTLTIGICNGFQIITNLGLLPALYKEYGARQVALMHNQSARYVDRWVDLKITSDSPWLKDIKTLMVPIAHGEGKFYTDSKVVEELRKKNLVAVEYTKGAICEFQNLPANPTGTMLNIAGITDETGRIFGLMPHPERAVFFTHLPHWTYLKEEYKRNGNKIPQYGPGIEIFKNAVSYFN